MSNVSTLLRLLLYCSDSLRKNRGNDLSLKLRGASFARCTCNGRVQQYVPGIVIKYGPLARESVSLVLWPSHQKQFVCIVSSGRYLWHKPLVIIKTRFTSTGWQA